MKKIILLAVLIILGLSASTAISHPGGTDKDGCHHCWTNCDRWGLSYGEYHCHGK